MTRHAIDLFSIDPDTGRAPMILVRLWQGTAVHQEVWLPAAVRCPIPKRIYEAPQERPFKTRQLSSLVTSALTKGLERDVWDTAPADDRGCGILRCDTALPASVLQAIANNCESQEAAQRFVAGSLREAVVRVGEARQLEARESTWREMNRREARRAADLRRMAGVD